jgi:hypothetical protein
VHGISPPDRHFHPITEFRCAQQTIFAALEAERAGYDAFVIGHFQEPGLTECRGAVDIPVIGLGEATMLFACSIGRRIGLVTIDPVFIPWHEEQVIRHGLTQRIGGVAAIKADLPRFMRAFTDAGEYAAVRADFVQQVRPLLDRGCDVLIPAGGLPMLLFPQEQPFLIDGAVVLEGIEGDRDGAGPASPYRRGGEPQRLVQPRAGGCDRRFPEWCYDAQADGLTRNSAA